MNNIDKSSFNCSSELIPKNKR